MTGSTDPAADPARIGALLTGRTAPRERIARALALYLASLAKADLSALLGEGATAAHVPGDAHAPGDAGAPSGGRWARLGSGDEAAFVHVPAAAAAAMGTAMLGGAPGDAADKPTPVDWHLCALVTGALGAVLPSPLPHGDWCDAPPSADRATGRVRVTVGGAEHMLAVRVPVSALSMRASEPAPSMLMKGDPRRSATIHAAATLDMAPIDLRHALAVAVGDVLTLDGQLAAVTVRADGRPVLTGALGHAGGRLCLRVVERAPEPAFEIARVGGSPPTPRTLDRAHPSEQAPATPPERRSAM